MSPSDKDNEEIFVEEILIENNSDGADVVVEEIGVIEVEKEEFRIQIDRTHYEVKRSKLTGEEIRQIPETPIGPDRDLYEVVPGADDLKIENHDVVHIANGERFFTAPAHINPGRKG
jgi:hypothetical protein